MGERRGAYRVSVGNLKEREHLENVGLGGKVTYKIDLQEIGCCAWTD
jgi:hypothetical protein